MPEPQPSSAWAWGSSWQYLAHHADSCKPLSRAYAPLTEGAAPGEDEAPAETGTSRLRETASTAITT
jgi:hypothetical protein